MDLCERHSKLRCVECAYIEQLEEENKELISLTLWSARRLPKTWKEYAYDEIGKITGKTYERL